MNAENRYPVTASLFMLREMKHRQEQVARGYQLLRRKAEALRLRGRQAAAELAATQAVLGHTLREAYISLAAVKFTNGESNAMVLENIGQAQVRVQRIPENIPGVATVSLHAVEDPSASDTLRYAAVSGRAATAAARPLDYLIIFLPKAQVRVQRIPENISGVATVSLHAVEDPSASDTLRYAGLGAGGHRTSEAKKAFRQAVHILIKFASLRNTCILLDEAIRTTLRKVNGIEKVIMPKLKNTESYILMEMDEREREEFHRLKMVKAKKIRTRVFPVPPVEAQPDIAENSELSSVASASRLRSLECLTVTSVLYPCTRTLSSTTDSGGDFKPVCYPHNWDDDDLLF